jgi:hypothetical protein
MRSLGRGVVEFKEGLAGKEDGAEDYRVTDGEKAKKEV